MGIFDFVKSLKQKKVVETQKELDFKNMTLMYENQPVVDVEFNSVGINNITKIHNFDLLPLGTTNNLQKNNIDTNLLAEYIGIWLSFRVIPDSRPNIQTLLEKSNIKSTAELSCRSFNLSFSDNFWFKPQNLDIKWEEINLHQNGFSNDIGDVLFDPTTQKTTMNFVSPDPTTRGEDAKRWISEDNDAYLLKTNYMHEQVAYNECVASLICDKLNAAYVQYETVKGEIKIKSNNNIESYDCTFAKCKNFCQFNDMYLPADYLRMLTKNNTKELINFVKENYPTVFKEFQKMIVLDFVIANEDRHSENFGFFIKDGKISRFAPIFDSGNSMYFENSIAGIGEDKRCKFYGHKNNKEVMLEYIQYKEDLDFFKKENFNNIKQEIIDIYKESSVPTEKVETLARFVENQINEIEKIKEKLPKQVKWLEQEEER